MNIRTLLLLSFLFLFNTSYGQSSLEDKFLSYTVDLKTQDLRLFYKDENNRPYRSIQQLKVSMDQKGTPLVFAMNGGMYMEGNIPLGLYIESGKLIRPLNSRSGSGNFYMKPNGVFYFTTDGKAYIKTTSAYTYSSKIRYATQSGPMLVIDGQIHPSFSEKSTNVNLRNGVGILPDGKLLFVISKTLVSFYEMASYFKEKGCKNALYLDGAVSKMYLPSANWIETGGDFGVMIGELKKK